MVFWCLNLHNQKIHEFLTRTRKSLTDMTQILEFDNLNC